MKFSKEQYADLKVLAYKTYMIDQKNKGDKGKKVMLSLLDEYHNDELTTIITNTLMCPFDLELYKFLSDKQVGDQAVIKLASSQFQVSTDIVSQKVQEYVRYSFINCVNSGMISASIISELSMVYLKENSNSSGKSIK